MSISISQFIPPPPAPRHFPRWCPYVCSLHLCLYFCPANRFICTISWILFLVLFLFPSCWVSYSISFFFFSFLFWGEGRWQWEWEWQEEVSITELFPFPLFTRKLTRSLQVLFCFVLFCSFVVFFFKTKSVISITQLVTFTQSYRIKKLTVWWDVKLVVLRGGGRWGWISRLGLLNANQAFRLDSVGFGASRSL